MTKLNIFLIVYLISIFVSNLIEATSKSQENGKRGLKKIRMGWPFGEVYVPTKEGRSLVKNDKRNLSPAIRLQQMLDAHNAMFNQIMKMQSSRIK